MKNQIHAVVQKSWFLPAVLMVLAMIVTWWTATPSSTAIESPAPEIDTLIPSGFVLVPIEVQNRESLDSLIGQFAVVNLYAADRPGPPLASGVRLLRAPRNPEQFGVLVPDAIAPIIVGHESPLRVVVENRKAVGKRIEIKRPRRIRRNLIIEEE